MRFQINYKESISRLEKLIFDLKKEESEIENENEIIENEIREIRKINQERIAKIISAKKKKLKNKEAKVLDLKNEKMQIFGAVLLMFSEGKITKDELEKVAKLEAPKEEEMATGNESTF